MMIAGEHSKFPQYNYNTEFRKLNMNRMENDCKRTIRFGNANCVFPAAGSALLPLHRHRLNGQNGERGEIQIASDAGMLRTGRAG